MIIRAFCAIIRAKFVTFHFIPGKFGANNRVVWLSMVWLSGICCTWGPEIGQSIWEVIFPAPVQQSPDNHTMLNHTTLLFAPNLPGIKRNVNNFALIIAQKCPDIHTVLVQFSTFTAFIHQLLMYFLWIWRHQISFADVSIIWFWITREFTNF